MSVIVHDPELWKQVMGYEIPVSPARTQTREKTPSSGPQRSSSGVPRSSSQLTRANEWLTRKATRNMTTEGATSIICKDFAAVTAMCEDLRKREDRLLQELDSYLAAQATHDQRKREMLYKKWSERVFAPVQAGLSEWMDSSFAEVDSHKRNLFSQYLELGNHKEVFLDTIAKDEYNPFTLSIAQKPVKTGAVDDPLTAQLRDCAKEEKVLMCCDTSEGAHPHTARPLGRNNTDPVLWLAMQLVQINSRERQRSRQRLKGTRNCSHMDPSKRDEEVAIDPKLSRQELRMPHKRPIHHTNRTPLCLEWSVHEPST